MLKETDLYAPVVRYLSERGYEVKAEVKDCDVVAMHSDQPGLLIVELKIRLNLELLLQAADRLSLSNRVYIAFPDSAPLWRRQWRRVRYLCKRLELGILTLNEKSGMVKARLEPAPYAPRGSQRRQKCLQTEFSSRVGDPNVGGCNQQKIMTAYRQDALRCAAALAQGVRPVAEIREQTQCQRAGPILQKDHYGWFQRVQRGHYQLSHKGEQALEENAGMIEQLHRHSKTQ